MSDATLTPYSEPVYYFGWKDEEIGVDQDLFSSVSGSLLGGAWVRPSFEDWSPYSTVEVYDNSTGDAHRMQIQGSSDTPGSIGLTVNGYDVTAFEIAGTFAEIDFPVGSDPESDIHAYFAPLAGTYSNTDTTSRLRLDGTENLNFMVDTMTISVSAVPEPTTYAALFGAAALGLAACRRRNRR